MGAFSGFLIIAGVMILFGSAMSLGLTFLHSMQGDPWAPLRMGSFISSYVGVDFGIESLLTWLGWGSLWQGLMDQPFYRVLFFLGIIIVCLALSVRSMSRQG